MKVLSMLIGLSMIIWMLMFAQAEGSIKINKASITNVKKDSTLLLRLKNCRIVLKDGSIKKNCKVNEINEYWITYEKGGSMHDQMIDKIRRIELDDGTTQEVIFNQNNKPELIYHGE